MRLEMRTDKIQYGRQQRNDADKIQHGQDNKASDAPIVLQRPPPSEPMAGVGEGDNFSKVLTEGTIFHKTTATVRH